MEKEEFHNQLLKALQRARAFAEKYVLEPLPAEIRCRVKLNSSYDGHPKPADITLYPQDSSPAHTLQTRSLTVDETVDLLWRSSQLPVWIDVSVVSRTHTHTVVELCAAGRFTANEDRYYYSDGQRPSPLGIKGPALPPFYDQEQRERFSIHRRASCWTLEEYRALRPRSMLAWSLELGGPDFDDEFLSRMDQFQYLEIVELTCVPVRGTALCRFSRMPSLRIICLSTYPVGPFALGGLEAPQLEELVVRGLSSPPSDLAQLTGATPLLKNLALGIECIAFPLVIPELPTLERLEICAEVINCEVQVPRLIQLATLSLNGPFSDETVCRMLEQLPSVTGLHLGGTHVSSGVVQSIRTNPKLTYANLGNTHVSAQAIVELRRSARYANPR